MSAGQGRTSGMTLDPRLHHLLHEVTLGSAVARSLGIRLDRILDNGVVLAMPFKPATISFADVIHGGTIATLIDIAAASAFVAGAHPTLKGGATTNMTVHFLAAARSTDLFAEASVIRRGRVQTVTDVAVTTPAGQLIAKGIVTNQGFS